MSMALEHPAVRPWYRHFWPWFIMALPAAAVVGGLTTVAIAYTYQDSVVRDDWYKEGKAINQDLGRDRRATQLGLSAQLRSDADTGEVTVQLHQQAAAASLPPQLMLYFSHPTRASADQALVLTLRDGVYHGKLRHALQGRFYVELGTPEWRLLATREFPLADFDLAHE